MIVSGSVSIRDVSGSAKVHSFGRFENTHILANFEEECARIKYGWGMNGDFCFWVENFER